ncbi:MAG: cation:proton antiporter, partial [Deltaproteobacteria bacterium]|nr:cation:proton antiporter [Deltaproteobacteria bacterium]
AFERLRLPSIAGFLIVGALAGPGGVGVVSQPDHVSFLAEMGVVFLLFEIGLELPVERLQRLWRTALVAGGVQVVLTGVTVAFVANWLGVSPAAAFVLGGIVAMSSTALAMRLLVERGQVDAPQGRLAVAILIFQDLSIVPLLLAIPLISGSVGASGGLSALALVIGQMLVALGGMLLVVRVLVPRVLDRAAHLGSPDLFSVLALIIVLGSALAAHGLGLTLAVGAFLAGVAATASPYSHQLFSEIVPLRGVMIGLFFTAVGMMFEPRVLVEQAPSVLAYLAAAIVFKAAIVAVISARLARENTRIGILAGAALAQTGEFSFVLAETAHAAELLPDDLYQVVIAGSILSLLATPFLIRVAPGFADFLLRPEADDDERDGGAEGGAGEDRVIVIGFGHTGQTLARTLRSIDVDYIVMEVNARSVEKAREAGEPIVFGDATRPLVLRRLGVEHARLVAVAINDPLATRRIVSRIHAVAPQTPVLARTRYVREIDPLEHAGARIVVAEEYEGALELVARTLAHCRIPTAAVHNFINALREEGYGAIRSPGTLPIDPWLVELLEQVETSWIEVPRDFVGEVALGRFDVRARTGASVLIIERAGLATPNPSPDQTLRASDRLLVLGDKDSMHKLELLLSASGAPSDVSGSTP